MSTTSGTLEHTADLGLWVEARGLAQLFEAAAPALAQLMVSGPRDGRLQWIPVELDDNDLAGLMVRWLGEVVYLWDGEGLLVVAAKVVEIKDNLLDGRLGVIPVDHRVHKLEEPVKAVTYHQAKVQGFGERWRAEVILDV